MDLASLKIFLRNLGKFNHTVNNDQTWITTTCPLAPYTHAKGMDTNPSFGVTIKPEDISRFHCFACGYKGTLSDLCGHLYEFSENPKYKELDPMDSEILGLTYSSWDYDEPVRKVERPKPLPEGYENRYPSAVGHPYLNNDREIDDITIKTINLRYDDGANKTYQDSPRILFPGYTTDSQLLGLTGRATEPHPIKQRDYEGFPKSFLLLGSHLIKDTDEYIVLVEGVMDYARLIQYNIPAVATMFAGLTEYQYEILSNLGKPIILMYDDDEAGHKATDKAIKMAKGNLPVIIPGDYPNREIVKDKKLVRVSDPDELTYTEVHKMIDQYMYMY